MYWYNKINKMELIKRKKITQKLNFRRNFLKYQSLGIKVQLS